MTYIPLARKWRPKCFANLIGQEHITRPLQNALAHQTLHHAYLFTGTRGIGKTTIARIFAKALNCEQGIVIEPCLQCSNCLSIDEGKFLDLIEVDGASRTRVEDTRELLENIQYAPSSGRFKIFLIDEVHMLSTHSFNALLKTLEEPPAHVKFLLATTDPQKIPATILSRCLQFNLQPLSSEVIYSQLAKILEQENFHFEPAALQLIANKGQGSMRDALSLCEQCMASFPHGFRCDEVQQELGLAHSDWIEHCIDALLRQDGKQLIVDISRYTSHFDQMIQELLAWVHECSVYLIAPSLAKSRRIEQLEQCTKVWSPAILDQLYFYIEQSASYLEHSPNPLIGMQMLVMRLLHFLKAQVEPLTPAAPQAQVATPPTAMTWTEVFEQLKLDGIAKSALSHTSMQSFVNDELTLNTHAHYKTLFSTTICQRIEQALSEFYQQKIKLNLLFSDAQAEQTPAIIKKKQIEQNKSDLKAEVLGHPLVQAIISDFQGEIVENTMTKIPEQ